jgi:hypothetical protein
VAILKMNNSNKMTDIKSYYMYIINERAIIDQ